MERCGGERIGLIDEIGTVDDFVAAQHNLEAFDFGEYPKGFAQMSSVFSSSIAAVFDEYIARQRYQLR